MLNWEDVSPNHILDSDIWRCLLGILFLALATASLDSNCYTLHNSVHFLSRAKGTYFCTDPLDMIPSFKRLITSSLSVSFLVSAAAARTSAPLILPPFCNMLPNTTAVKKNLLKKFFFWVCIVLSRSTFTALKCCNEVLAMQMLEVCQEFPLGPVISFSGNSTAIYVLIKLLIPWNNSNNPMFSIWTPFCCVDICTLNPFTVELFLALVLFQLLLVKHFPVVGLPLFS